MAFERRPSIFTPVGTAEPYCWIQKADTKFKELGEYKVDLTFDGKDPQIQKLIDRIVKAQEENFARICEEYEANPPQVARGKKPLKPYEGDLPFFENDDGTVTFKFKANGAYIDKKTKETKQINLSVVDSKGKPIKDVPNISGGSRLKAKFNIFPYGFTAVAGASVKLQLEGVMLVELVEFGQGGDQGWGEEAEEDGYIASQSQRSRQEDEWSGQDEGEESESAEDTAGEGDF